MRRAELRLELSRLADPARRFPPVLASVGESGEGEGVGGGRVRGEPRAPVDLGDRVGQGEVETLDPVGRAAVPRPVIDQRAVGGADEDEGGEPLDEVAIGDRSPLLAVRVDLPEGDPLQLGDDRPFLLRRPGEARARRSGVAVELEEDGEIPGRGGRRRGGPPAGQGGRREDQGRGGSEHPSYLMNNISR